MKMKRQLVRKMQLAFGQVRRVFTSSEVRSIRLGAIGKIVFCSLLLCDQNRASTQQNDQKPDRPLKPTAYEVKAAYLYNFGKFVEWPAKVKAGNNEPFMICVLGKDPFGASLDATIAGEAIDGRSVLAKRLSKPQEALNCRVLFISSSEDVQLKEILSTLEKASVLTVSDMSQFTRRGGMIQFVDDANRVRFEVNLMVAERAGLTLSSQLLKVAISARRNSQPGD
jgi:hypothetical protein